MIIIIIPIVAAVVAFGFASTSLYSTQGPKALVEHIHPHLNVTFDGTRITVPSQIGIDSSLWKDHSLDQYGTAGFPPFHTHDASGTIHVKCTKNRNYTLGEFLNIWGGLDTNGKTVIASVDGKPVSAFRDIILRDGEQISLNVGR
jgi:sulfur carrier protein ThiS